MKPNAQEPFHRAAEIVEARTTPEGDCLIWTGNLDKNGYGRYKHKGREWPAHRLAWAVARGPVPEGLHIDHLCFNKRCVKVEHLEPVTPAENSRRSNYHHKGGSPTEFPCGHPRTPENSHMLCTTKSRKRGHNRRYGACKACRVAAKRRAYKPKPRRKARECPHAGGPWYLCKQCKSAHMADYYRKRSGLGQRAAVERAELQILAVTDANR